MNAPLRAMQLQMAQAAPAPATAITYVGACTPQSGSTSATANVVLPGAAAAGDTAIIAIALDTNTASTTGPAGSSKLVNDVHFGADHQIAALYAVRLTSADIAAGTIAFTITNPSENWTLQGAVFRGVSAVPLDVAVSSATTSSAGASPYSMTAPGLTTTKNGDALIYFGVPDPSSGTTGTFGSAPIGFTKIGDNIHTWSDQTLAYMLQAIAGATGDATCSYTAAASGAWGAWLVALKAAVPAITITDNLTAGTVGGTYSKTIVATLVDGATGPVTITASPLPAGLTLSGTTDNGNGTYAATVSGTPTTATSSTAVTTSIGASNGTLSPTVSHVWSIASATSSPVRVAAAVWAATGSSGTSCVLPAVPVQPGDLIVVKFSSPFTAATGITDSAGNAYTLDKADTTHARASVWHAIAAATSASLVVTVAHASVGARLADVTVYRKSGATWSVDTTNLFSATFVASTPLSASVNASGQAVLAGLFGLENYGTSFTASPWTGMSLVETMTDGYGGVAGSSAEYISTAALSSFAISATFTPAPSDWQTLIVVPYLYT